MKKRKFNVYDQQYVDRLRLIAIKALCMDDYLLEQLVLKGGVALNLIYKISNRSSFDIDFSMKGEFENLDNVKLIFKKNLEDGFSNEGLHLIDFKMEKVPENLSDEFKGFWCGYKIEFKVLEKDLYNEVASKVKEIKKYTIPLDKKHSKIFTIDISCYEVVDDRKLNEVEGVYIYVYSEKLILFEKIRAICQQQNTYRKQMKSQSQSPRTKDFYDIYCLMEYFKRKFKVSDSELFKQVFQPEDIKLLKSMFQTKKVSFDLLLEVKDNKEFHSKEYSSLEDTVEKKNLHSFDFYFDFCVELFENIHSLWNE